MQLRNVPFVLASAVTGFVIAGVLGIQLAAGHIDLPVLMVVPFGISGAFLGAGFVSGRLGGDHDRAGRTVGIPVGTFSLVFLPALLAALTRFGVDLVPAVKLATGLGVVASVATWLWLIMNEPEPASIEESA